MDTERALNLLAQAAQLLHENGQRTAMGERQIRQLGRHLHLGLDASMVASWDMLLIGLRDADDATPFARRQLPSSPTNVNMQRVIAASKAIDATLAGAMDIPSLEAALARARELPPIPTPLFVLAAVAGALALALIFGADHWLPMLLIAVSAAVGALLRRWLAGHGGNLAMQAFVAALLAGVVGGVAMRLGVPSSLGLIALCPCMILVPGPHILNGALDMLHARISLGLARLVYAAITLLAIAAGVVLGMVLVGSTLPVSGVPQGIALWLDVAAAAVAAACYSVYFSSPARLIGWAVLIGALAHLARWVAIDMLQANVLVASWLACLVAGSLVVALNRKHLHFAAVGFAAVVAMVPGMYVFRWASAMFELVTVSSPQRACQLQGIGGQDLSTALLVTIAMVAGLVLPILVWETWIDRGEARASASRR
ncbi:MAG: threonine/serine exporter family protein [Pseudomonadota bacterium]|nr:threonine/serine exporter family protein [Pseudomonadota bacterium]